MKPKFYLLILFLFLIFSLYYSMTKNKEYEYKECKITFNKNKTIIDNILCESIEGKSFEPCETGILPQVKWVENNEGKIISNYLSIEIIE